MRELPRQLSADELAGLFEGRTAFVDALAAREDPLGPAAEEVAAALPPEDKRAALAAHPAIGAPPASLSSRSAAEQGADDDPGVLA